MNVCNRDCALRAMVHLLASSPAKREAATRTWESACTGSQHSTALRSSLGSPPSTLPCCHRLHSTRRFNVRSRFPIILPGHTILVCVLVANTAVARYTSPDLTEEFWDEKKLIKFFSACDAAENSNPAVLNFPSSFQAGDTQGPLRATVSDHHPPGACEGIGRDVLKGPGPACRAEKRRNAKLARSIEPRVRMRKSSGHKEDATKRLQKFWCCDKVNRPPVS